MVNAKVAMSYTYNRLFEVWLEKWGGNKEYLK